MPLARSAIFQLVAGVGIGAQLLVGRNLLGEVLAQPGGGRFSAMAPDVAVLVAVTALVALADLARSEEQRLLSERVAKFAADEVLEVSSTVELIAFEHPQFADRLQRARW